MLGYIRCVTLFGPRGSYWVTLQLGNEVLNVDISIDWPREEGDSVSQS
jgi:hypothetical protein